MNTNRYSELMSDESKELTPEEIVDGWHFCWEFDGLLVGPGMDALKCCHCLQASHPVYDTAPPTPDVECDGP